LNADLIRKAFRGRYPVELESRTRVLNPEILEEINSSSELPAIVEPMLSDLKIELKLFRKT